VDEIVIVGASVAGVRAAEALRAEGFAGSVTLIGRELHFPPYDRPPLSKELLSGAWGPDRGRLRVAEDLDVTLRLGVEATSLTLGSDVVGLSDGSEVGFDGLVIATGATPRTLGSIDPSIDGVFVLRTFEDAMALRAELAHRPRVVVIGAGFIGAEVAATCRGLGLDVAVVDPAPFPMERALGPVLGEWAAELHRSRGVDLDLGVAVAGVRGDGRVRAVVLEDRREIPADLVVVAVGVTPEVAWLEHSGLEIDNGVVCDQWCRALGTTNVVAAGDLARWMNPLFGRVMRIEHWANAVEQGEAAAKTLLYGEGAPPFASVPYFWSNQYDTRIQFVGIGGNFHRVTEGSLDEPRFVATFELDGRLVGAACVNAPARLSRYRRLITEGIGVDELEDALA
jgi:NADPH-dependent 2,4-dienoyl-CoA reductase/sulfur reductase-like enzyme